MLERAIEILAGEEAYVVGGTVRDELLGRPVLDLDIACAEPERAARAYADASDGAPFPLSAAHGGWRVALSEGRTVDFTPLRGSIEDDLATRDFTINAIARPLAGGEHVDPFDGRGDLEERIVRAVGAGVFEADPLRLLRAVRFEEELGFVIERRTERLLRDQAKLVDEAGRRADARGAAPAGRPRLGAPRRARAPDASRRLARSRRARRRRRFAGLPAGRLSPGLARPAADLARAPPLRRRAAAQLAAVRLVPALVPPLSPLDRAVGRPRRSPSTVGSTSPTRSPSRARPTLTSRCSGATSSACRRGPRSGRCWS